MAWWDRIMVVGGAGFIGGALVKYLGMKYPKASIEIVDPEAPSHWYKKHNFRQDDLMNFNPTSVFNCACLNQEQTELEPDKGWDSNVLVPLQIVHALEMGGYTVPFVHTSSASIYNDRGDFDPKTVYARQKLHADRVVKSYKGYRIVRLSNVFGPGMKFCSPYVGFVAKAIIAKLEGSHLLITDPEAKRTYVWIEDVMDIYHDAAAEGADWEHNAFSGWTLTPLQVATAIGVELIRLGSKRTIDGVSRDVSRLSSFLGSRHHTHFNEAVDETSKWAIDNYGVGKQSWRWWGK